MFEEFKEARRLLGDPPLPPRYTLEDLLEMEHMEVCSLLLDSIHMLELQTKLLCKISLALLDKNDA